MKRFSETLSRALEFLMALSLLTITVTVVTQVILSSAFNSSITGANEIITKLFVYITAIGAAVAVGRGEHIAVTVTVDQMSTASQRVLQILNLLFVALLNGIVGAYSVHWINITGHFLMPTTQLPRLVAQLSIPVGSVLAVVFCFAQLVQLRNGDARTDSANEEAGNT